MAVTFNDGFEDNDLTNAPAYTQYEEGGTIDISTDAAYQGTYGVRCECASRYGWTTFALYNLAQSPSSTDYFEFEIMWRRTAETNTTVFTGTCVGWRVESPHWGKKFADEADRQLEERRLPTVLPLRPRGARAEGGPGEGDEIRDRDEAEADEQRGLHGARSSYPLEPRFPSRHAPGETPRRARFSSWDRAADTMPCT